MVGALSPLLFLIKRGDKNLEFTHTHCWSGRQRFDLQQRLVFQNSVTPLALFPLLSEAVVTFRIALFRT